ASWRRPAWSGVIFHVAIWLFLPLAVHLHTILPSSLVSRRRRIALLAPLYLAALGLVVLAAAYLVTPPLAYWWRAVAVLAALAFLLLRTWLPVDPAVKVANRTMLFGLIFGLVPFLLFYAILPRLLLRFHIADVRPYFPFFIGMSTLSVPVLPMSYIYAIYKHHLGALEFRANRLLGV